MKTVNHKPLSHFLSLLTLVLVAVMLLSGCQEADKEPIKIGILHSLTGTMAISEKPVVNATLLAIEEINAKGGVLGRKLIPIIADGKSDWPTFAREAERLITEEKVAVIFGCWTSACRKSVKPIVEKYNNLLFYPLQYEGMEKSPNIIYTGTTPNQQVIPAISWTAEHLGKRLYLIGSDYIYPRVANWIIKEQAKLLNLNIVGESYIPLGSSDAEAIITEIRESRADVIINTINGDSNISFFRALAEAGFSAKELPVMSFSIGESELAAIQDESTVVGHYAAWSYFQSIDTEKNRILISAYKNRFGKDTVISDPMATAYFGVYLWAQVVGTSELLDTSSVVNGLRTQSMDSAEGLISHDFDNQHTWRAMRIGQINDQKGFNIAWDSGRLIAPQPYPLHILPSDGDEMIDRLYGQWGQSWAGPAQRSKKP